MYIHTPGSLLPPTGLACVLHRTLVGDRFQHVVVVCTEDCLATNSGSAAWTGPKQLVVERQREGGGSTAAAAAALAEGPEWQTAVGWFPWSQRSAAASSHLMTNIWGTFSQIEEIRVSSPPWRRKEGWGGVWVGGFTTGIIKVASDRA